MVKKMTGITVVTIAINLLTVYFLIFYNTTQNRAYYILGICFLLGMAFQNMAWHSILRLKKRI